MQPPEQPAGYMWSLGLLYLVFALALVALWFPCRWYDGAKGRGRSGWMRYI